VLATSVASKSVKELEPVVATAVRSSIPETLEHAVSIDDMKKSTSGIPVLESDLSHHDQFLRLPFYLKNRWQRRVMVRRAFAEEVFTSGSGGSA
jgi:hypothetical protein